MSPKTSGACFHSCARRHALPTMNLCNLLDWDTNFFGVRVGRLNSERLSHGDFPAITNWCDANRVECLYFLTDAADTASIHAAEDYGFRLMDIRITLRYYGTVPSQTSRVRIASPEDLPALKAMVRGTFLDTRFYRDSRLAPHADRLYETWIERDVKGHAAIVLVADDTQSNPAGFISCHYSSHTKIGEISLIAVRRDARGQGIGSLLVDSAKAWFFSVGATQISVVTNGANISAQKLYQRKEFHVDRVQIWFHR